ncbi:glycosyl hydrolase-related protein, partial [Streptomyces sp. NPDC002920]
VKLADDGSGDVVVRLHEAHGARTRATLTAGFDITDATATDLLERPLAPQPVEAGGNRISLRLRPFELVTLRLRRG